MRRYQIATVPVLAYAALFAGVFGLMSSWGVTVRLLAALAIVAVAGVLAKMARASRLRTRRTGPTLAQARAGADRRGATAGQSPRDAAGERASAV